MRRAARKDALHRAIGQVFMKQCGWAGLDLSRLGDGLPDWLFIFGDVTVLVEVKSPGAFRPGSKTVERQAQFRENWTACPVYLIETVDDAWKQAEALRPPVAAGR